MLGLLPKKKLLSDRQELLLEQERVALATLHGALEAFGADVAPGDARTLDETIGGLSELFMLVIAGEFNSGKSSVINALLGEKIVAEGVTPTTDAITLLRYGPTPERRTVEQFLEEHRYPADVLRQILVVDTPGANAVIRRHEELTREFIPRADLVLFVTSADRPFTESERAFLELIRDWGKKIVIVLNKVDLLEPAELEQVVAFIREHARPLLSTDPEIFPVSARLAQRARAEGGTAAQWEASRFAAIERYILETLDEEQRVRLKLLSPLGVAKRLADKYLFAAETRLAALQEDAAAVENIDRQLDLFRDDMTEQFGLHESQIGKVLSDFELRGIEFFDETIKITNVINIARHSDEIGREFERYVVADVPQQIEDRLQSLIDWMVSQNLKLWQSTVDYLRRERASLRRDGVIGDLGGSFEYNRAELLESVAHRAQDVVETYDQQAEAKLLADDVRGAIAGSALVSAGAIGAGALIALLHAAAFDITGGVLAAGGLAVAIYLIPNKRSQVKRQFRERVAELRAKLNSTMRSQFERENEQMLARVREAIGPYTRFVRAERTRLVDVQRALSDAEVDVGRIRAEIER